ncbi:MAG: pyridoxal-phosphate dependent enzyme [Gemmatimonadetes bacterium]|nr:pyridoxal-phosphate dependent enzyme [Gemmatimonadota bacterium]
MSSLSRLKDFLAPLPRISLARLPTPLVRLERVGADLGIDLWMKRDDCTGLALGGNKARKLEYVVADAQTQGHDTLVTVGPLTSNHTMMTAAAARRAGMQVHCVVGGGRPGTFSGNLLLLEYLGARLHFVDMEYATPTAEQNRALRQRCREVTEETGGYWIPGGATMPQAEPGYMNAVLEICGQMDGAFDFHQVVLALGTGSTTTGVMLGLAMAGIRTQVEAVRIQSRHVVEEVFKQRKVAALFQESVEHFDLPVTVADVPHREIFGFADEGYGVPNAHSDRAIRMMAEREGYFLDTVYTAKAFGGLVGMTADGRVPRGAKVLFLHTGGLSMTPAAEKRYVAE